MDGNYQLASKKEHRLEHFGGTSDDAMDSDVTVCVDSIEDIMDAHGVTEEPICLVLDVDDGWLDFWFATKEVVEEVASLTLCPAKLQETRNDDIVGWMERVAAA